jgi:hypothetical protein
MTATRGVSTPSRASKTRPDTIGIRSVSKKPGPAEIIEASAAISGRVAEPSTTIGTAAAPIGRPRNSAADSTPGIAVMRRRSSSHTVDVSCSL